MRASALAGALVLGIAYLPQAIAGEAEALGETLFFDVNLSRDRTQSCATCHSPDHGLHRSARDCRGPRRVAWR